MMNNRSCKSDQISHNVSNVGDSDMATADFMKDATEAKRLLALSQGKPNQNCVLEAGKILENALVYHPFEPMLWQIYSDVDFINGHFFDGKAKLARYLSLITEAASNSQLERSGAWSTLGLPSHFSSSNFKTVESIYRILKERGYDDARLNLYLANLCKLQDDYEGFLKYLDCATITDEFYALHVASSSDFFYAQERVRLQDRLFRRIDEMGTVPLDLYLPEYFRCISFEIQNALSQVEQGLNTSAADGAASESIGIAIAMLPVQFAELDIMAEYQVQFEVAVICQFLLLREIGSNSEMKKCSQILDDELSSPTLTAAVLLGHAHREFESLNLQEARSLYSRAQVEAAKAIVMQDKTIYLPSLQPLAMQADAFAGLAACDRLFGRLSAAESSAQQALQRDPACGDALRILILTLIEQKNFDAAAANLLRLEHDPSARNQSIRFTRMKLDSMNLAPAAQSRLARLQQDSFSEIEKSPEHIWRHIFDLFGENLEDNCTRIASILSSPLCTTVPFSWEISEVLEFKEPNICNQVAARLLLRSNWFYESVGMVEEAAGSLTAALEALEHTSQECNGSQKRHNMELILQILWKRHQLFLRRGSQDLALNDLTKRVEILKTESKYDEKAAEDLARTHFAEAVILFKSGNQDSSEKKLLLAIQNKAEFSIAKGYLGVIYSQKGAEWRAKALLYLQKYFDEVSACGMNPERTIALAFAKLLCQDGESNSQLDAVKICTQILSQHQKDSEALMIRASAFTLLDRWNDALMDYTSAIATGLKGFGAASVHYFRGRTYQRLERFSEALTDFVHSKELGNDSILLLQNLAFTYEALGLLEEAVNIYGKILKSKKISKTEQNKLLQRRSALYVACGQYELALQDLSRILASEPKNTEIVFARGCAFLSRYDDLSSNLSSSAKECLQLALKDFCNVLEQDAKHLKSSIKRRLVASLLDIEIEDDDNLFAALSTIEEEMPQNADPEILCSHAISLAKDLLKVIKSSADLVFQFFEVKDSSQHTEIEMRLDSGGMLRLWYCHQDGLRDSIGIYDIRDCHLERKKGQSGFFSFRLQSKTGMRLVLTSLKYETRESFFRWKYLYEGVPFMAQPTLDKPLKLLKAAQYQQPHDPLPTFYMGLLFESLNNHDFAKSAYTAALNSIVQAKTWKQTQPKQQSVPSTLSKTSLHEDTEFMSVVLDMTEPVRGLKSTNRLRSKICFRLAMTHLQHVTHSQMNSNLDDVIKILDCAFRNDESRKESIFYLGWLSLKVQRFEDAARWFTLLTNVFPTFAEGFNNLGVVEEILGNDAAATKAYRDAIALDTDNDLFKCNYFILQLRTDIASASDVIEKSTRLIERSSRNFAPPLLARGFAYNTRNDSRRDVPDHINATQDYKAALEIDPNNFHARVLLAYAYIVRGNITSSRPHFHWLQLHHAGSKVLSELNNLSVKLQMVYRGAVTDFVFAAMLNPNFHSLHYSKPNIDIGALLITHNTDFDNQISVSTPSKAVLECIDAAIMHFIKYDYAGCTQEITKFLSHCNSEDFLFSKALGWRALCLASLSQNELASADCQAAIKKLGIHFSPSSISQEAQEFHAARKHASLQSSNIKMPSDETDRRRSFGYSVLCLLGSLKESLDHTDFEGPKECYTLATELIPFRLEAQLNLANIYRRFNSYDLALTQYLEVLNIMLVEEAATGSNFRDLQSKLIVLMSSYHSKWNAVLESAMSSKPKVDQTTAMHEIEQLQGELLWLCEEFRKASDQLIRTAQKAGLRDTTQHLIQVANKAIKKICQRPWIFAENLSHATTIYAEYTEVVQQLFNTVKPAFKAYAENEDQTLEQAVQEFVFTVQGESEGSGTHLHDQADFVRMVFSLDKSVWAACDSKVDSIQKDLTDVIK